MIGPNPASGDRVDDSVDGTGGRRTSNPERDEHLPEWMYTCSGVRNRSTTAFAPRAGDVILVSRRINLRSWLRSPLATFISWRIQRCTRSPWNHVAGYVGNGELIEAEWNCGVVRTKLDEAYPRDRFRVEVARAPREVDRLEVAEWWKTIGVGGYRYDWRAILLMRVAAALEGPDGIRRRIRMNAEDGAFHCAELCAQGWQVGGFAGAVAALVEPSQFEQFVERRSTPGEGAR